MQARHIHPTRWPSKGLAPSPHRPGRIADAETDAVRADKGSDAGNNRAAIAYGRHLYQERTVIERLLAGFQPHRRVATRSDKTAANDLGFVSVASFTAMPT